MRKRKEAVGTRVYLVPEYFMEQQGNYRDLRLNALVYAVDDEAPQVIHCPQTTYRELLPTSPEEMRLRDLLLRGPATDLVVPDERIARTLLRPIMDPVIGGDLVYRTHGISRRARRLGLSGFLREAARYYKLDFPESLGAKATYFRQRGSDGGRHMPKEAPALFDEVLAYDKAVVEAMRKTDRALQIEEREFYEVNEKGHVGSTNAPGIAYDDEQELETILYDSGEEGLPIRAGLRVVSSHLSGDCVRLEDYLSVDPFGDPAGFAFGRDAAGESLFAEGCPPYRSCIDLERKELAAYSIVTPYVPEPATDFIGQLSDTLEYLLGALQTYQVRQRIVGRTLPCRLDGRQRTMTLYPRGHFPLIYREVEAGNAGCIRCLRQYRPLEPAERVSVSPRELAADIARAYRFVIARDTLVRLSRQMGCVTLLDVRNGRIDIAIHPDRTEALARAAQAMEVTVEPLRAASDK